MPFKRFQHAIARWMGREEGEISTPPDAKAVFHLVYHGRRVGVLSVENARWTFQYTDEFRQQSSLRPIVQFPDLNKTYEAKELWPFFGIRIPSLKQAGIQQVVKNEGMDDKDEVQLLRRFGRRTIANPFELLPQ